MSLLLNYLLVAVKDERGIEDVDWDISSVDDLSFSGCERIPDKFYSDTLNKFYSDTLNCRSVNDLHNVIHFQYVLHFTIRKVSIVIAGCCCSTSLIKVKHLVLFSVNNIVDYCACRPFCYWSFF